jgi:hypothetical protein
VEQLFGRLERFGCVAFLPEAFLFFPFPLPLPDIAFFGGLSLTVCYPPTTARQGKSKKKKECQKEKGREKGERRMIQVQKK